MFLLHWFCTILSVITPILKLVIIAFSPKFDLVFVSSSCLVIQCRSFDHNVKGGGELISSSIY